MREFRFSSHSNHHSPPAAESAPLLDFVHLCGKPRCEVVQPAGQVHAVVADTLDGGVECGAIPVVELADREQVLEIVAGSIKAKRRVAVVQKLTRVIGVGAGNRFTGFGLFLKQSMTMPLKLH